MRATIEAAPDEAAVALTIFRDRIAKRSRAEAPAQTALQWASQNASVATAAGRRRFEPWPYQTRFLEDSSQKRIVLKARQVGMSNAVAIEALYRAIHHPDRQILFVSRTGQLAQQLITYCQHTLGGLKTPPTLAQENLSTLVFGNGARILSLAATPSTGRGFPASDVYLDEFAFAAYDQLIYESIVPALAPEGTLTVLSTPNGRANMYFRVWSGLEGGEWSRHTIRWQDCPRYSPEWAERQRQTMTRQSFAQEYDVDFVTSGDAVFDPDDLARCHDGWNPNIDGCSRLVTAWDIGRRQDHTVGITLGERGGVWHLVNFERFLAPYPAIQSRIDARHQAQGDKPHVESNGVGDPVIENLRLPAWPFVTGPKSKVQAIQALQLLIQQGRFKHGVDQLDRELGLYQWRDDNLIQDCVMAAAIAAYQIVQPERTVEVW